MIALLRLFLSRISKLIFLQVSFRKKKRKKFTLLSSENAVLLHFDIRRSLCKRLHLDNFWSSKLASPYWRWSARSFLLNTLHCRYKLKCHDEVRRSFEVSRGFSALGDVAYQTCNRNYTSQRKLLDDIIYNFKISIFKKVFKKLWLRNTNIVACFFLLSAFHFLDYYQILSVI